MNGCIGTPNLARWKGMKETSYDSPGVGSNASESSRSHLKDGRISHTRTTSSISPSTLKVSQPAMSDQPGAGTSKLDKTWVEGRLGK